MCFEGGATQKVEKCRFLRGSWGFVCFFLFLGNEADHELVHQV